MKRIAVSMHPAYEVLIGDGALAALKPDRRAALVIDENVARLHADRIRAWTAGFDHRIHLFPSGERHKTLDGARAVYDFLARERFERSEPVIAVGGGVVGDLAGFAAATYRRGVPFFQVPTTLLAMVDASVGGKVAVDHPAGKNLIGAFHQPSGVFADTAFLQTLPERERWAGLAEVVKTALLSGGALLDRLDASLEGLAGGTDASEGIADCVAFKASIVAQDPDERGVRAILNLGHTAGHAFERLGGFETLLHGEAVAIGLKVALALSGFAEDSREFRLVSRLQAPALPGWSVDAVVAAMQSDKKVEGGRVKWVLLDAAGKARFGCDVDEAGVRVALAKVLPIH